MVDLKQYIEKKTRDIISTWDESNIYAISFFLYSNEAYEYKGYSNVTEFCISYNTESDCGDKGQISEERWNYAFWRQNEVQIIEADEESEGMRLLFKWYNENGVSNIGYENPEDCYDNKMRYIGKGPIGYYELLLEVAAVAKSLQESGFVEEKFGKPIPIIIHDLEYSWYVFEATRIANPNGEADTFFAAMKELGFL